MGITMFKLKLTLLFLASLLVLSCDDEADDDNNPNDIGSGIAYDFDNADFSVQNDLLGHLEAIASYGKNAVNGDAVSSQALSDMFNNEGGDGNGNFSYTSNFNLANYTSTSEKEFFENQFLSLASAAQSWDAEASDGNSGYLESGNSKYLVVENGIEPIQLIEKGLMGAAFYYQIQQVFLGLINMNADNSENVEGQNYTQLENNWDQAFAFFGAPTDWLDDVDGTGRFWAEYAKKTSSDITGSFDSPSLIMNAFIDGRRAIVNNDTDTRETQIEIIKEQLEIVSAGAAVHNLNIAINNSSDNAIKSNSLSQAWAFIYTLKFGDPITKSIQTAEVNEWLDDLGTDFWSVSTSQLTTLRDKISSKFGFDNFKEAL